MSIKKTFILFLFFFHIQNTTIFGHSQTNLFDQALVYHMTIMLDPAGSAQHAGRTIDDCFERGLTLQCTDELKKQLEKNYPGLHVILTHLPGEPVQPLQHANFANRLNVDLYLSIHFYHESSLKPSLYIYYFSYGKTLCRKPSDLCFPSYEQAYLCNKEKTFAWATLIKEQLCKHSTLFDIKGPYGLPFRPLIGITSPALAIEAGLKKSEDWRQLINPIIQSLNPLIAAYKSEQKEDEL